MPIGASSQTNPVEKTPASAEQTGSAAPAQRASGVRSSAEGGRAGLLWAVVEGGSKRETTIDGRRSTPGPRWNPRRARSADTAINRPLRLTVYCRSLVGAQRGHNDFIRMY